MNKIDQLEQEIEQLKASISLPTDEVLTLIEAASILKISYWQISKLARDGGIPVTKKCGDYRITKSKLIAWINHDGRERKRN